MKDFELSWETGNEPDWIKEISNIDNETIRDGNISNLNLNISIVRRKVKFSKLIDKFLALIGLSAVVTTQWEKVTLGVFLAYILCPIQIRLFKNNDTKKVFDLVESELGDNFIDKNKLEELNDDKLLKIVAKLKREGFLEEEDNRYYFNQIVLKSFNIGK